MRITVKTGLFLFFCLSAALMPGKGRAGVVLPEDGSSAVILAYHRIGEDAYSETNLRTDQFLTHFREISDGSYTVMAVPDIIKALRNNEKLPPKSIGLTFEGAYKSTLKKAIPTLLENNIPFTIFFAGDRADNNAGQHLNWDEIKSLQNNGLVTFGILPASYTRLSGMPREKILEDINKARIRFREKLGEEPKLFSYPFGEYSLAYRNIVEEQGFEAAFGLHSGAVSPQSDLFTLPRFTMTEVYGDTERLKLVSSALPLPSTDIEPEDPHLKTELPAIGFSVHKALAGDLDRLSCFISGQPKPTVEILGTNRIQLQLSEPLSEERTRINCTIPGPKLIGGDTSWRWLGMLLINDFAPEDTTINQPQAALQ